MLIRLPGQAPGHRGNRSQCDVLGVHVSAGAISGVHAEGPAEVSGSAFDAARWGWDCPTMVFVDLKRRLSMSLETRCVLFI